MRKFPVPSGKMCLPRQHPRKEPEIIPLRESLSRYWSTIQGSLFPWLREEPGTLTPNQQRLVTVLEMSRIEEHSLSTNGYPGRPSKDRVAIARSFVAKAVYNMGTTRILLDRLASDVALRRICGWESVADCADPGLCVAFGLQRAYFIHRPLENFAKGSINRRLSATLKKLYHSAKNRWISSRRANTSV